MAHDFYVKSAVNVAFGGDVLSTMAHDLVGRWAVCSVMVRGYKGRYLPYQVGLLDRATRAFKPVREFTGCTDALDWAYEQDLRDRERRALREGVLNALKGGK